MIHLNLARGNIDRDAATRDDPQALARARSEGLCLFVDGQSVAMVEGSLVLAEARGFDCVFLGSHEGSFFFACDVTGSADRAFLPADARFEEVRRQAYAWSDRDTELAVEAVAICQWLRSAAFCESCGSALEADRSGWFKRCPAGHTVFPRTDPAVIMAITNDDERLLLGRNSRWSPGKFSVLAGFVEVGESAEKAVVRESWEECGVEVGDVCFVASQPWPFPRSLMLAFTARTSCTEADIQADGKEMAEAHFFSREEFLSAVREGRMGVPSLTSVAAALIEQWLGQPLTEIMDA